MKCIGIIDDSEIVLETAKEALTGAGFRVVTMMEPTRFMLLEDSPPDLLLVDINMPEVFGDDMVQFFREVWGIKAPIYLFSSLSERELEYRANDAGADGYICKEWGMARLVTMVKEILGAEKNGLALLDREGAATSADAEPDVSFKRDEDLTPVPKTMLDPLISRCEKREKKILSLLSTVSTDDDQNRNVLQAISFQINDWLSEAEKLGSDKMVYILDQLMKVLSSWRAELYPKFDALQLEMWVGRLTGISLQLAANIEEGDVSSELEHLQHELDEKLVELGWKKAPTPSTIAEKAPASQTVFKRFTIQCTERQRKILSLLQEAGVPDRDARTAIQAISIQVRDWTSEATLLGFDKLATVLKELEAVLKLWLSTFNHSLQGAQLVDWVQRLTDISQRLALEAPGNLIFQELLDIRAELKTELEIVAYTTESTPGIGRSLTPSGRRILILDDSPIICEVLLIELKARGYRVAIAQNMEEFQQQLSELKPEIIFLDINMPEIKGDEVCRRLRQKPQTRFVPIIFLSSLPDEQLALLARQAGASGHLSKQHGMDALAQYLDDLLASIDF